MKSKTFFRIALACATLSLLFAVSSAGKLCDLIRLRYRMSDNYESVEELDLVAKATTSFSSALFDIVHQTHDGNFVVSPLSASLLVAMLLGGARGETGAAIRRALRLPMSASDFEIDSGYSKFRELLEMDDANVTLSLVNRLYPTIGFEVNQHYSKALITFYRASPQQLDFSLSRQAVETVNTFVENQTRGKIRNVLTMDDVNALTKLMLVNGVYFKGLWKYRFDAKATMKRDFYVREEGRPAMVDMMHLVVAGEPDILYGIIPELDAKCVVLPYQGDTMSMVILLPNKRMGLFEMEEKMRHMNYSLNHMIDRLYGHEKVQVYLPRFKLESKLYLRDPLNAVGAGLMFSDNADFSGMREEGETEPISVSGVIQKVFIEVNEDGGDAGGEASGTGEKSRGMSFYADHPFHVTIAANLAVGSRKTWVPLFHARVADPTTIWR